VVFLRAGERRVFVGALAAFSDPAASADAARRFPFKTGRFSVHIYARTPDRRDGADLRARMFSPLGGTMEDPATGSANGAPLSYRGSQDHGRLQVARTGRNSDCRTTLA